MNNINLHTWAKIQLAVLPLLNYILYTNPNKSYTDCNPVTYHRDSIALYLYGHRL